MTPATLLDIETASRLRAVLGRLSRRLRPTPTAVEVGLTPTRISVLLHVVRAEEIRLSELGASEGINPTMLSRAIAELTGAELLERVNDAGDRRAAWVKPTATGRRLAEQIRRERTDALNVALGKLPEADRRRIERAVPALELLADGLRGGPG